MKFFFAFTMKFNRAIYIFICLSNQVWIETRPILFFCLMLCYKKNSQFVKNQNIHYMRLYVRNFFPFCKCNWLCGKIMANFVISCVELFSSVTVHFCWIFTKMHFSLLHYTIFFILHVSSTIWILFIAHTWIVKYV